MADRRSYIKISDTTGNLLDLALAQDDRGKPMWETSILSPVNANSVVTGEITYASFLPRISGVWEQSDLSGGMGVRLQKARVDARANTYYYAEWTDASITGQIQKGPAVKTLATPANSGPMSGYFELGGTPYFCLGRIIAKWNSGSDTLSQVRDLGSGGVNTSGALFNKDGLESLTADVSTATGASDPLNGPDARIAQQIRATASGIAFLGRIDCQLQRVGLSTPSAPTVTVMGTTGTSTFSYKVTAVVPGGETPASTATTITNGNATLSSSNYNIIGIGTAVAGATSYNVYRTAAPAGVTTGKIGVASSVGALSDIGLAGDGTTPPSTDTSAQISGDVRLTIQADVNGAPSGSPLDSARITAMDVSMTAATLYSFRFDALDAYALTSNEPFWIVMDASGTSTYQTIQWTRSTTNSYTRGTGAVSANGGNTWTNNASSTDYYFQLYAKTPVDTVFIGADDNTNMFATTTDGSGYSPDTYRSSTLMCTVGDRIVRDVRAGSQRGFIQYSVDGTNWSESLPVGDPNEQITALIALNRNLIVCKTGSVWAVDIGDSTIQGLGSMIQLASSNQVSTNGQGSCYFKGTAYIPFNGKLMAIRGDFIVGWQVFVSVGPESLPEWDSPWGIGRIVCVAASRFHLYALMSTSGAYRLLKSRNPIDPLVDGEPGRRWHGAIAQIGDGTQSCTEMHVYDPGGTSNPRLFVTTTSNNLAEVVLPRFENPASDANYVYDTSTTGDLYYSRGHASFPVHPKAWINETMTFLKRSSGDYADMLYDLIADQEGFRRLGRLYDTGILPYPTGTGGVEIDRRLRINTATSSRSPVIQVSALTYAVRPAPSSPLRKITFTVDAEDNKSAADLGDLLGIGNDSQESLLIGAGLGAGTRTVIDHRGRRYESVLLIDVKDVLVALKGEGSNRTMIQIEGVQVA